MPTPLVYRADIPGASRVLFGPGCGTQVKSYGQPMVSAVDSLDIEVLYGNGGSLYGYLGANPWIRSDAMGLSWVESYEGVLLPIVAMAGDGLLFGVFSALDEIYQGYHLMANIHAFVQGAAFDQEENFDWALDWSASDDDNPYFSSGGGYDPFGRAYDNYSGDDGGLEMARFTGGRPYSNQIAFGKKHERMGRRDYNAKECKRYVTEVEPDGQMPNQQTRRMYDGQGRGSRKLAQGHYMEVKSGKQGLTHRVKRQIDFDRRAIQQNRVKGVKWVFYSKRSDVSPDLLDALKNSGIRYEFAK